MMKAFALFALVLHVAVFGLLALEARTLAHALSALEQEVAAGELAEREAAREQVCAAAVWPRIPMHCLERVSAVSSGTRIY